jgi:CHAT domain-containing protein
MKKIVNIIFSYLTIALVLYLITSIIHLSWYIANPEGFFGFSYFIEVGRMVLTVLIVLVILIFGILFLISSIVSLFQGKSTIKSILKTLAIILFMAFMTVFNSLWYSGASYLFASKLSEKYSLIKRTEKYLKNGEIENALELASESYKNQQDMEVGWFFVFTKLYSLTDFDRKEKLMSKYSATLNYGFALKGISNNGQTGEEKFNEAIKIANDELLKDRRNELLVFPTLSLAEINLVSEKIKKAEKYLNDLIELQEKNKTFEDDAIYLINTYLIFAVKASAIGDFSKSIKLQEECLRVYEESELSKESRDYLSLLITVTTGKLYNQNFTKAANLLIKSQPIAEDFDHTTLYLDFLLVKGQYCLSSALNNQGDERVIEKGFWDNLIGSSNKDTTLERKLLKQAEHCFIELLEYSEDIAGKNSFNYLNARLTLANYYYITSQFKKAKSSFDEALSLIENSNNENDIFYYETYLKSLLNESKINQVSIEKLAEIENFVFNKLSTNFSILSEEEKELYAMRMQNILSTINQFYINEDSEKSRQKLYNNIISYKSLALSSNNVIRNFIKNSNDNHLKTRYNKILNEKKDLKMKLLGFDYLYHENEIKKKEKELLEQINNNPSFKPYQSKRFDWATIKNELKPNEVAIEFIHLPQKNSILKDSQYYALLITPDFSSPRLFKLFNESEIRNFLNVQGDTKTRVSYLYNENHIKLYNIIFGPIDQYINENATIYVSKSGLLYNISFSALTNNNSWNVNILQSTRYIAEKDKISNINNVALYGGIDYNTDSDNIIKQPEISKGLNRKYENLNYTMSEVINISKLFTKDNSIISKIFVRKNATEFSFRDLSGSDTDIIHVATHGYYDKKESFNTLSNYTTTSKQFQSSPLLRSGLLFAGANNLSSSSYDNDGIMTSLEISEMDLSKVDLVVLSACETGLGDVLGSEGVFGLQRAFKLAGARSLIVSLWQVPDKQTSELMLNFYKFYLNGFSKSEALKKAQDIIKKEYPNPYYWAGFELIQ